MPCLDLSKKNHLITYCSICYKSIESCTSTSYSLYFSEVIFTGMMGNVNNTHSHQSLNSLR
jgi:hypothetical protein